MTRVIQLLRYHIIYSMHKPEVANIASKTAPIRRISPENGLKGQILQGNVFNELH